MTTSESRSNSTTAPEKRPHRAAEDDDVALVGNSAFFDEALYALKSGVFGDRKELARHYLEEGELDLLSPSVAFDVAFYLAKNPDVAQSGISPLVHFLRQGKGEGRYPNPRELRLDAAKLERSGLFNRKLVEGYRDNAVPRLGDIERHLIDRTRRIGQLISCDFDPKFYSSTFEDVREYGNAPLLHYIEIGRDQGRVRTDQELQRRKAVIREHVDEQYYGGHFEPGLVPSDLIEHYVLHGERLGFEPTPDFCVEYYKRRYPDLRGLDIFYFEHFIRYGRNEGRVGRPDFSKSLIVGGRSFDPAKPTVMIANHEASRTGAPLLGLLVGLHLAEDNNVITSLRRGGTLEKDFLEASCLLAVGIESSLDAEYLLYELKRTHHVDAIVINSVEASDYALAALYAGVPSVALVHEFAEYTQPYGRMANLVAAVDRVIVPAELVKDSLQCEVGVYLGNAANNVIVRAQGNLPHLPQDATLADLSREDILRTIVADADTKIILGAGHVHIRKGIDLFVQTAAEVRKILGNNVRFVWVGAGYEPVTDPHYSLWVADMIRRLDLEDIVYFIPPQGSLDLLFDLADVFYLPSRLDPFPNVAVDAFMANRAVVCFSRATGIAECLENGDAPGAAVAYCDVYEAAKALVRLIEQPERERRDKSSLVRRFDFAEYISCISDAVTEAQGFRAEIVAAAKRIEASGTFDWRFYTGAEPGDVAGIEWRSIIEYAARGAKGLMLYSPRPGFSENLFRGSMSADVPACVPLDEALAHANSLSRPPATHGCTVLSGGNQSNSFDGRVAIHLHLHYADLAAEFFQRLSDSECKADLIITTTAPEKCREIYYTFRTYNLGSVNIIEVPNRGRDIGPLLVDIQPLIRSGEYDIVGHFHGKRSLAVDGAMGDRWRSYLLDTLIGGPTNLQELLSLFMGDPTLGLVFAEDRHCVGWAKNKNIARGLARKIVPEPELAPYPLFPLGTMFWARPAILEPLWQLDFTSQDFPDEPVPYDGTVLHAIERLLPAVCESSGYSWRTAYREGTGW